MKRIALILLVPMAAMIVSCERHSWEETKVLHKHGKHGGDHGHGEKDGHGGKDAGHGKDDTHGEAGGAKPGGGY